MKEKEMEIQTKGIVWETEVVWVGSGLEVSRQG